MSFVVVLVMVVVIIVTVFGSVSAWNCNDTFLYLSFARFVVAVSGCFFGAVFVSLPFSFISEPCAVWK